MHSFNSLTFYISGAPGSILPGHPLWDRPLSGRSADFAPENPDAGSQWTIGRYFESAGVFVSQDKVLTILGAAVKAIRGPQEPGCWDISLNLLKHGAFYHPIQMILSWGGGDNHMNFVLNGAVTDPGLALSDREAGLLGRLETTVGEGVVPKVFCSGRVQGETGKAGFLMAQWLDGFYEFHQTNVRGKKEVVVWRPGDDNLFISMDASVPLYREIAKILTLAWDVDSGEQIYRWHHAAGDFIVNPLAPSLDVRLITARAYGLPGDEELPGGLPGGLLFFINLCLRMQLDRLDGVGAPVFLGEAVLKASLDGFIQGLACKDTLPFTGETLMEFISGFAPDDILAVMIQMLEVWPPGPSEVNLIRENLPGFAGRIRQLLK